MSEEKTADQQENDEQATENDFNLPGRYTVKPEFWDTLLDALPPWLDEISAVALLVFGVISSMALLDISADEPLAVAMSETLRSLFGYGSIIVTGGIFLLGVMILLPKIGVRIELSAQRILAAEIAFISALAILHLYSGDTELRALARAGEGGGYLGWGISLPFNVLFGSTVALMIFVLSLVLSLGVVAGIRRTQITTWLSQTSHRLQTYGERVRRETEAPKRPKPLAQPTRSRTNLDPRSPGSSIVLVRPDFNNLPPSMRPGAAPPKPDLPEIVTAPVEELDEIDQRLVKALDHVVEPIPDEDEGESGPIGTLLPKKSKTPQMVRRPDGREKRYFSVEGMKEAKKVGRRDKNLPPLELLQDVEMTLPEEGEINYNVVLIENTLLEFDINVDIVDVKIGPTVTQYAVQPFRETKNKDGEIVKERTRLNKIAALANDLALSLSTKSLRLETPVPGHSYMGVEVPNKNPSVVALRSVYESKAFYEFAQKKSPLAVPLGRDVAGDPVSIDLGGLPHMLIAGTTGSGKSVCIAALATALVLNNTPDQIKLIMLDPKMVELNRFNGLPHMMGPAETDIERIVGVLRWCTREMDRRYKLLEENAARNIDIYNSRLGQRRKDEHLPYVVILVDEIGDLMMSKPEETERAITRLAQMARAVGMHLVVATQRPSVDVITGLIKANFPARASFAVASGVDSRVILDAGGAENLIGQGDMLYLAPDAAGPKRLQGCFVSGKEVRAVVQYWKDWAAEKGMKPAFAPWERGLTRREFLSETDPMLEDAIELVVEEQEASASMIQRKLGLGYPRAARIIDMLEELGIIGESVDGGRTRKVLIEKGKDPFQELIERRTRNK